jgi:diacylglycerol O-acyltransferase / wax synthase
MTTEARQWPTRMNPTDALFWSMDKIPEMRSTIGALVILDRAPARERVREEFERISDQLVRMHQRVVEVPFNLAPPEWVDDEHFDLEYHLRYVSVPAPGGLDDLLAEMGPLYATAFDRDRPLWEAYVAEGLIGGRGAIFVKMHHCLVDGVGGTRLFEGLLSQSREMPAHPRIRRVDGRATTPAALLWRAAAYNVAEVLTTSQALLRSMVERAFSPWGTFTRAREGLRMAAGFGRELAVSRPPSPLHQSRSLSRRLSTFEMSLADIDAARERLGATNNDVILTIVSGAMHRWHTSRGSDVKELCAMVPVNIRDAKEGSVGNRIGLLAVRLPVGEPSPLHRLRTIQKRIGQIKTDQRARLYPALARLMTALPLSVVEQLSRQQTNRTNFVCTNVPGPRRMHYLAGEAIERVYPYAPLVGDHPVAVALYTYCNTVCVGLDVDPMAMEDLQHFRDALQESYEEVLTAGRLLDIPRRRSGRHRSRRTLRASA